MTLGEPIYLLNHGQCQKIPILASFHSLRAHNLRAGMKLKVKKMKLHMLKTSVAAKPDTKLNSSMPGLGLTDIFKK